MRRLLLLLAVLLVAGCATPTPAPESEPPGDEEATGAPSTEDVERWKEISHSASCTTEEGITVSAQKRDLAIDVELLFPEGYNASGARFDVKSTHWQFAPNSGAMKSPTHYLFALQPRGTSFDADEGVEFNPRSISDAVYVTAYHIKRTSENDAYLTFALQMNDQGFEIVRCRDLD